jgi:hypothetical protein
MSRTALFIIYSLCFATAYGVIFKWVYPHVRIDNGFATIFALGGFLTAAVVSAVAHVIRPNRQAAPAESANKRRSAQPQEASDDDTG